MKSGCSLGICFSWNLCNVGLGRDRGLGWRLGDLESCGVGVIFIY